MFQTLMHTVAGFGRSKFQAAALVAASIAGLATLPTVALARHPNFHVDIIVPAPVCEPVTQRVWVAPVYEDVTEQVWVPVQTTTQLQRVDVTAEYAWRDVISYDRFGRPYRSRQQVLIAPAHCESRPVDVVVCPAHYELQTHPRLACDGHWREVVAPVIVEPSMRFGFHFPF